MDSSERKTIFLGQFRLTNDHLNVCLIKAARTRWQETAVGRDKNKLRKLSKCDWHFAYLFLVGHKLAITLVLTLVKCGPAANYNLNIFLFLIVITIALMAALKPFLDI